MNKISLSLFFCSLLPTSSSFAASAAGAGDGSGGSTGEAKWAFSTLSQSSSSADTRAVWADGLGNVYMVGRFLGTVDFWGTTLVATSTSIPSGFIAKVSQDGSPLWVKKLATNNFTEWHAVAGLPSGEIYVGGSGAGTFDMDGVSFTVASTNGQNALLLKLNSETGMVTWGGNYGGSGNDSIFALSLARDNKMAFGGTFNSSISFGGNTFSTNGGNDNFFGRVDPNGNFSDLRKIGSSSSDLFGFLEVDSENNAILGLNMSCTSGNFDLGVSVPCSPNSAIVAKLLPGQASPQWYRVYNNSSTFRVNKITANTGNNSILLGGHYAGAPNLGGPVNMPAPVGVSGFLLMLDKDGNFIWQKQIGDGPLSAGDQAINLAISQAGYIGLIGISRSMSAVIDECTISHPNNNQNPFFAILDMNGSCIWSKKINGSLLGYGYHVAALPNSDFVYGGYTSAADFGFGVIPTGSTNRESFNTLVTGYSDSQCPVTFTYEDWKKCHFTVDEQGDSLVSGPESDADRDQVPNVLEYAFNSNPKSGLASPTGFFTFNNQFVWHYYRNANATDLVFELQFSTNLSQWYPVLTYSTDTYPIDVNTNLVYLTDTSGIGQRKFFRWNINLITSVASKSQIPPNKWVVAFKNLWTQFQSRLIVTAVAAPVVRIFPPDFRSQLVKAQLKADVGGRVKWTPPEGGKNLFMPGYIVNTKRQNVFLDKKVSHSIEAVADRFYEFAGWEGACADQNTSTCVLDGSKLTSNFIEVKAKFVLKQNAPNIALRTLRAVSNKRMVRLSWKEFMSDAAVIVERRVVGQGAFEEIASVPANRNQYFDDLAVYAKQKYEYRIRFANLKGASEASKIVRVNF